MVIGFSSSMLTTLLPMLVADLSTLGSQKKNIVFQLCINFGLVVSMYVLYLVDIGIIGYYKIVFIVYAVLMSILLALTFYVDDKSEFK